jgi:hypothetical protein
MEKPRRNRSERLKCVQSYIEQGEPDQVLFCESIQIKTSTFGHWLREYKRSQNPPQKGHFVRVLPEAAQPISLHLVVGKCHLTFEGLPPSSYVHDLIKALA